MSAVFIVLFSLLLAVNALELTEDTAFLLSCPVNSKSDLDFLHNLMSLEHHIDIFQEKFVENERTVVDLLTDEGTAEILLKQAGCFQEKSRSNLKKIFKKSSDFGSVVGPAFHQDYRSAQNIVDQLSFYSRNHSKEVKILKSIGKSHEGRDLMVIHITSETNPTGSKPLIWIMAGQHAREWIAPATAMVFIEEILKNEEMLKNYEFAVMPLVNPDGYEYSRNNNRMWRKNRRYPYGVDLNRNWDHKWSEYGGSDVPSGDTYGGPSAASEPEIRATQNYVMNLSNRIIGFDVHSYSQLILRNYGWTRTPSPDESLLSHMSDKMSQSMLALHGIHYKPILSAGLYPSSGSAEDWLYVKAGIPGFVMELRDKGKYGFNLPRSQIKPTGEELYIGIITAISTFNQTKHHF